MTVITSSVSNVSSPGTAIDLEIFTNITRSNFKVTSNLTFFHNILLKPVKLSFGRRGWSALPTKSIFHILAADSYQVSNEEPVSAVPHGDSVENNICLADVILNSETTALTADACVSPNVKLLRRRPSRKSGMPPVKTEELVPGAPFIGKVRAIQPFGAFVDFGAFTEGLIHISNLSSGFVTDVKSIVSVGQEVRVYVVNVNVEAGQISLTMRESHVSENSYSSSKRDKKSSKLVKGKELKGTVKNLQKVGSDTILPKQEGGSLSISKESFEDPVNSMESSLKQVHVEVTPKVSHVAEEKVSKVPPGKTKELVSGTFFTGRITSIKPFGAFVDIGAFTEGLVHISNMKDGFVPDINVIVSIGQEVRVKVLETNVEKRRISLSMRESSDNNVLQHKKDSSSGGTSDKPISSTKFVKGQEVQGTVKNLKKVRSDTNFPKQEGNSLPISEKFVEDSVNCMASSLRQVHEECTPRVSHVAEEKLTKVPPVKTEDLIHGASFTGRVTSIKPFGAFVDVGAFTEGLVHISNMKDGFVSDISSTVFIGQEVRVKVLETNVEKRRISLTMQESCDTNDLQKKKVSSPGGTSDKPVSSIEFVKGQELEGTVKNLKKVGPDTDFPEQEGGSLPIFEESFEESVNSMESSLRQVPEEVTPMVAHVAEEKVSKVPPVKTEELVHGASFTGRVTSVKPFGTFVDIGAFTEGLVHISNMKDGFVSDVNSIVSIGQEVRVMVLETDVEKRRISLSMRESRDINDIQQRKDSSSDSAGDKPISATKHVTRTKKKSSKLIKGQELVGTVKSLNKGGSIISLPEDEEGFLPRSEESVEDIVNVTGGSSLQVGQEIKVRVVHVARGQVILTMQEEDDVQKHRPEVFHVGVVHKATNPFVLAFLKNKDIAKFLDERDNMQKVAESS